MTKTNTNPANSNTPKNKIVINRIFTKEGQHPYDTVDWDHRDIAQTNWKTGEEIFRQENTEFPTFWSENAAGVNLSSLRSSEELLKTPAVPAAAPYPSCAEQTPAPEPPNQAGPLGKPLKWQILDIDHPDVEKFLNTKKLEEEKIRVLRDAGFDMDLENKFRRDGTLKFREGLTERELARLNGFDRVWDAGKVCWKREW